MSPDPRSHGSGEDDLHEWLARIEDHTARTAARFTQRLRESTWQPLRDALQKASSEHADLVRDLDPARLETATSEPEREEAARAAAEYLIAVRRSVVEPLFRSLSRLDLGAATRSGRSALSSDLKSLPASLPPIVRQTEASGLFAAGPADGTATRLRKWRARVARWLSRKPRMQAIPLRALGEDHAERRLPHAFGPVLDGWYQACAEPIALVELAVHDWARAIIPSVDPLWLPPYSLAPEFRDSETEPVPGPESGPGPESAPAEPESAPEPGPEAVTVAEGVLTLDAALAAAAEVRPFELIEQEMTQAAGDAQAALVWEAERSGTFMAPLRTSDAAARGITAEAGWGGASFAENSEAETEDEWTSWHRIANARLQFTTGLLATAESLHTAREAVVRGVVDATLRSVLVRLDTTRSNLDDLELATESAFESAGDSADALDALADEPGLNPVLSGGGSVVARTYTDNEEQSLELTAQAVVRSALDRLVDDLGSLPESLELHVPPSGSDENVRPDGTVKIVRPRQVSRQALDALVLQKIGDSTRVAVEAAGRADELLGELAGMLAYGYAAAREELRGEQGDLEADTDEADSVSETEGESGPAGTPDAAAARELALNAIRSGKDQCTELAGPLRRAAADFAALAAAAFDKAEGRLLDRLAVESGVQEQFDDLRARAASAWRRTVIAGRRGLSAAAAWFAAVRRRTAAGARWLLNFGRSAVGASGADAADRFSATVEAVAGFNELMESLPLVYRRLFARRPVSDTSVLVGRDGDLEAYRTHLARRAEGRTRPFLIVGPHGSGRTSLVGRVISELGQEVDTAMVRLDRRCNEERELVQRLGEALGLSDVPEASLEALAEAILARPSEKPALCVIENLEFTYKRSVAGRAVIEGLFSLMSRTDPVMMWVCTMCQPGWDFLERTSGFAAHLPEVRQLSEFGRKEVEELITVRHVLSGLPLRFEQPELINPLLRRRLRRARTEEERQASLRSDYFDRLTRVSGRHPVLAIFYWLRSTSFDETADVLRVKPIKGLDFQRLSELEQTQRFALKALLEHTALSARELAELLRLPLAEGVRILESLVDWYLIARTQRNGEAATIVDPDATYRVRRLLVHPISEHLRASHILY
ncbi:MAG: AAA family ATPase [Gemmatimonadota bacterium]